MPSCTSPSLVKSRTANQWKPQSWAWGHTTYFWLFLSNPDWSVNLMCPFLWRSSWMPSTYFHGFYGAEAHEVYSFTLISQEASYSDSTGSITFVGNRWKIWLILWGVRNLGFPALLVWFLFISVLFLAAQSMHHPSALKTSVHLYIGCLHRPI